MLVTPGDLRVPAAYSTAAKIVQAQGPDPKPFHECIRRDGIADLGFLAIALRKYSTRLEDSGIRGVDGDPLVLLTQDELIAFQSLASALQNYHHDRPSRADSRRAEFASAVEMTLERLQRLENRGVIPHEMVITETGCSTPFGRTFGGFTEAGLKCLTAEDVPDLVRTIVFVESCPRDFATAWWIYSAWPPGTNGI
jgi:hypothetical protein